MDCCDLHLHTTASDGDETPERTAEKAASLGLKAIAVTDHDTASGCAGAARRCGELGIEFVPGVELSAHWGGREVHILGYFIDPRSERLRQLFDSAVGSRDGRNEEIVRRLSADGFGVSLDRVRELAGGIVGRPHIARAIVEAGRASSVREAFELYLAEGRPYYVARRKVTVAEAVSAIAAAGGVAAIAHPLQYGFDGELLRRYLWEAAEAGAGAVETCYTGYLREQRRELARLAEELGLGVSGGSDWHGGVKPGVCMGGAETPYGVVAALRARAGK